MERIKQTNETAKAKLAEAIEAIEALSNAIEEHEILCGVFEGSTMEADLYQAHDLTSEAVTYLVRVFDPIHYGG